ncbi:MAG: hypothetical protein JXA03_03240 [Bacteroidales bacterium]|nr:hypothetical protein [Bacteroidales bacterium]
MKKRITVTFLMTTTCLLLGCSNIYAGWVIKSGNVKVLSGTTIKVQGDLEIQTGATLSNSGTIDLDGDLSNYGTASLGTGTVEFTGASAHEITGSVTTEFATLKVSTQTGLAGNILVNTGLILNSADFYINDWYATLGSAASVSGYSTSNHIVTNGYGSLVMEVSSGGVEFPVGHAGHYLPVTIVNNGITDNFRVRVFDDVLDGGTVGNTISTISNAVNATWVITEETAGGSDVDLTVNWNASSEGFDFNRDYCGIGHYHNSAWDGQNAGAAAGSGPYSRTRTGITDFSAFAVGDVVSPLAIGLRLDVNAFLEGPYNGTDMNTGINLAGLVPLSQPFNTTPWNYSGSEAVLSIPNTDIVDWVLVELRDASSPNLATGSTMIARQAAFLKKDGTITGTDGSSDLLFFATFSQNLYAVVWHRNHLGVLSGNPLTATGGVYTYDFSTGATQAFGGTNGHKEIGTGVWGLVSGDGNADHQINNGDKLDVWAVQAGTAGYKAGDYNMDVNVNNGDKNDVLLPNAGLGGQVPDNTPEGGYMSQVPE